MKTFILVLAAIALQGGFMVEAKRFDARKVSVTDILFGLFLRPGFFLDDHQANGG